MQTLRDFDFKNKRVLLRCDFNAPFRIKQSLPTIEYLIKAKASKIILISHLSQNNLSLKPVAKALGELLGREVKFNEPGELTLLENLRFRKEEEENDENFAKELAELADIYINDAFSVCHRAHASIVGIPKFLPSGAGLLLEKEIETLDRLLKAAQRPLVAIIGGAKVETKVKIIAKLSVIADLVLIGGLLNKEVKEKNIIFNFPDKIIGAGEGLDIAESDLKIFKDKIVQAKTIFWNGPLGKIEDEQFSRGTKEIAEAIIKSGAFSIVGGGETAEFINKLGLIDKFSYVSTGGGAMLSYLSGEKLPGIEALD